MQTPKQVQVQIAKMGRLALNQRKFVIKSILKVSIGFEISIGFEHFGASNSRGSIRKIMKK